MPESVVSVSQFGGLNFTNGPIEVGARGATDAMNVTLARNGRLITRDGLTTFASPGLGQIYAMGTHQTGTGSGSNAQLLVSGATDVSAFNSVGTFIATKGTVGVGGFAQLSTGAASRTFMPSQTGTPQKWDGTVFANSLWSWNNARVAPTGDSRLVYVGDPHPDTLYFSDAGRGDVYSGNNFVAVGPDDGERLIDVVTWRELTFAFKQSKFYVFYGNSVASDGTSVFNYRTVAGGGAVDPGHHSPDPNPHAVCAGVGGVYYLASDGVYLTTGGVPERLSTQLDPWFRNESIPSLSAIPTNVGFADACIGCVADRLYVCPSSSQSLTFVLDLPSGKWTAYSWAMTAILPWAVGNAIPVPLVAIGGVVYKHFPTATTDNGTAITWSHKSGKYQLAEGDRTTITRESSMFGTGTVTLTLATDASSSQSGSVTLGTAPTSALGWFQKDQEGIYWQHTLSGTGQATVEALTHHVVEVKDPGVA